MFRRPPPQELTAYLIVAVLVGIGCVVFVRMKAAANRPVAESPELVFAVPAQVVTALPSGMAFSDLRFAPDGAAVFTAGCDGRVREWDAKTGEKRREVVVAVSPVLDLAVSNACDLFAVVTGDDRAVFGRLDQPAGAVRPLADGRRYRFARLSPDGRRVYARTGDDRFLIGWDATTGQQVSEIVLSQRPGNGCDDFCLSSDGRLAAAKVQHTAADDAGRVVGELAGGRQLTPTIGWSDAAFHPRLPHVMYVSKPRVVTQWQVDEQAGEVRPGWVGEIPVWGGLTVAADDTLAVVQVRRPKALIDPHWFVGVYGTRSDQPTHTLSGPQSARPQRLAFSPDGKLLAAGFDDGVLRLWQLKS